MGSSSPQKQNRKSVSSIGEDDDKLVLEKPSLTPDWSFPFRGQFFVDIDYKWRKDEYTYELSKLASDLKRTPTHSHPK